MDVTEYQELIHDIKQLARTGYKQGNHYKFEDILRTIANFQNEESPLDFD